ncbi:MAG: tetratricopeptide repeat protein [Myxococcota bacterium]
MSQPRTAEQWAKHAANAQTPEEALRRYQAGLDAFPHHPDVLSGYGELLDQLGRLDESEAVLHHLIRLEPDDPDHVFNLALFYEERRSAPEKAAPLYRQILAADPEDVEALSALGRHLLAVGEIDEAEHFLGQVLELEPDHFESLYNMAHLLQGHRDQPELAEALYLAALDLEPEDVEVNGALAELRVIRGNLAGAAPLIAVAMENAERTAPVQAPLLFLHALVETLNKSNANRTLQKLEAMLDGGIQEPDWELQTVMSAVKERLGDQSDRFAALAKRING